MGPFSATGLRLVSLFLAFFNKIQGLGDGILVSLPWAPAFPWPLKFWGQHSSPTLILRPEPTCPAQGCLRRHLQSQHMHSWVPQPEEAACPRICSSLCSPVVMSKGGAGVGNEKGSTALPRGDSAADKDGEDSV